MAAPMAPCSQLASENPGPRLAPTNPVSWPEPDYCGPRTPANSSTNMAPTDPDSRPASMNQGSRPVLAPHCLPKTQPAGKLLRPQVPGRPMPQPPGHLPGNQVPSPSSTLNQPQGLRYRAHLTGSWCLVSPHGSRIPPTFADASLRPMTADPSTRLPQTPGVSPVYPSTRPAHLLNQALDLPTQGLQQQVHP